MLATGETDNSIDWKQTIVANTRNWQQLSLEMRLLAILANFHLDLQNLAYTILSNCLTNQNKFYKSDVCYSFSLFLSKTVCLIQKIMKIQVSSLV